MATQYRPRIIQKTTDSPAYLATCKKEHAADFVKWLKDNDVPASLSGNESTESMETVEGDEEEYTISEIRIDPPTDYSKVKSVADAWANR